jgi:hypothetical protein
MEETEESDSDFWSELERNPELLKQSEYTKKFKKQTIIKTPSEKKKTLVQAFDSPESRALVKTQEDWEKEKIERTIERIKFANQEYLRNIKITVRNKTKKELRAAVLEIQAQFQLEVFTIKQDHDKMKEEISSKNREIYGYGQYNIDQNSLILNHQMKNPEYVKVKKDKSDREINELKELNNVFKLQLDAIKEITAEYNREATQALQKVKEVDNEIQKINAAHQLSMQMLRMAIGSQEEEILQEKQRIQDEFESFRTKISQEIEIRNLLDLRQQEFIQSLQTEIKDAKIILQNPRMRVRVHEKLKENSSDRVNTGLPKLAIPKEKVIENRTQSTGRGNLSNDFQAPESFLGNLSFNPISTPKEKNIPSFPKPMKSKVTSSFLHSMT